MARQNNPSDAANKDILEFTPYEFENHFILRLPEEQAIVLRELLQTKPNEVQNQLRLRFDDSIDGTKKELRHGQVQLGDAIMPATLKDLPCAVETLKTVDRKTFCKVADVSQVFICGEPGTNSAAAAAAESRSNDAILNEDQKCYQLPHGVTPSMRNVRKRRFRKTMKKKFLDAPEIDKELKRLLRADLEASNVRYEVINMEDPSRPELETSGNAVPSLVDLPQIEGETGIELTNPEALFGELSSSSDEDEDSQDPLKAEAKRIVRAFVEDENSQHSL